MKQFILLLKSFRLLNVFSMLFLLIGLRFYVFNNLVSDGNYFFVKSTTNFILFVLVIAIVSAAGYLINDIVDIKVDRINKPHKQLAYSNKTLWLIYGTMNLVAVLISILILNTFFSFLIVIGTIILLFWYSMLFQKLPILGNVVIALLAGVLPVLYSDFDIIEKVRGSISAGISYRFLILSYSFFGFFLILFREIIKDIEDFEGDESEGYRTLPILIGINMTNGLLLLLMQVLLIVFSFFSFFIGINSFSFYILLGLIFLYVLSIYNLYISSFSKASLFLKLTLFSGVLILFIL